MKVCYVVHTPFQLLFATILMKKLNTFTTLLSLEDGRNRMDLQHPFIQENWERYYFLDIRGLELQKKDYSIEKRNEICSIVDDFDFICLWSLHVPVNQIIMDNYKGIKKIYIFPEGLSTTVDYFRKSLHMLIGKIEGRYNFDYFFTHIGKDLLKHPKVKEMPYLITDSNINLLKLPDTNYFDFSRFDIILYSQPWSELKQISIEQEQNFYQRIFQMFPEKKILVFLHPRDSADKFNDFENIQVISNNHFPNEIYFKNCQPKLILSIASTIVINSAVMFPDVPHVLLFKLINLKKIRNLIKPLQRFLKLFPNIFIPKCFNEISEIANHPIAKKNILPSITEQEFFQKYFKNNK